MLKRIFLLLLLSPAVHAQQRMLPIGSSFKDAAFAPGSTHLKGPSFFPVSTSDANSYLLLRDSARRYSTFGHFLYQRELIEIRDSAAVIRITPLLNMSYGFQQADSTEKLYQNTRGARLEGTIGNRIFFTTSFYENQSVLPTYVSDYVSQRGEQYPVAGGGYQTQNAVIPGAARTKPFKTNGYDYAYATGMLTFFATQKWTIHWGNQPFFTGSGHRSLLWSDNSVGLMNLRMRYCFSEKLELQFVRARGLNLLRRPEATNGEAYYEPKSLSVATISFQPFKNTWISLFEGGVWYRGDSVSKKNISGLYFLPIPGAAILQQQLNDSTAYALTGADLKSRLGEHVLFYGQLALNPGKSQSAVYQLGFRIFPFSHPLIQFQIEYNHADKNAYRAANSRINYANYNLPVAHGAGSDFDELLIRVNWEYKHWYILSQTNYYFSKPENNTLLLPIVKSDITASQKVFNQLFEAGYRFNRTYGLEIFGGARYRSFNGTESGNSAMLFAGVRTLLTNQYFDF